MAKKKSWQSAFDSFNKSVGIDTNYSGTDDTKYGGATGELTEGARNALSKLNEKYGVKANVAKETYLGSTTTPKTSSIKSSNVPSAASLNKANAFIQNTLPSANYATTKKYLDQQNAINQLKAKAFIQATYPDVQKAVMEDKAKTASVLSKPVTVSQNTTNPMEIARNATQPTTADRVPTPTEYAYAVKSSPQLEAAQIQKFKEDYVKFLNKPDRTALEDMIASYTLARNTSLANAGEGISRFANEFANGGEINQNAWNNMYTDDVTGLQENMLNNINLDPRNQQGIRKTGVQLAQSLGTNAPSYLVSMATGNENAGSTTLGIQMFGSAYKEAREMGKTQDQAFMYALEQGAEEVLTDKLLGFAGNVGGGLIGKLPQAKTIAETVKSLGKTAVSKAIISAVGRLGAGAMSEFAQEFMQYYTENLSKAVFLDEKGVLNELNIKDAFESGLLGAYNAILMQGGATAVNVANTAEIGANSDITAQDLADIKANIDLDKANYGNDGYSYQRANNLNDLVTEAQNKIDQGKALSNFQKGSLEQAMFDLGRTYQTNEDDKVTQYNENGFDNEVKKNVEPVQTNNAPTMAQNTNMEQKNEVETSKSNLYNDLVDALVNNSNNVDTLIEQINDNEVVNKALIEAQNIIDSKSNTETQQRVQQTRPIQAEGVNNGEIESDGGRGRRDVLLSSIRQGGRVQETTGTASAEWGIGKETPRNIKEIRETSRELDAQEIIPYAEPGQKVYVSDVDSPEGAELRTHLKENGVDDFTVWYGNNAGVKASENGVIANRRAFVTESGAIGVQGNNRSITITQGVNHELVERYNGFDDYTRKKRARTQLLKVLDITPEGLVDYLVETYQSYGQDMAELVADLGGRINQIRTLSNKNPNDIQLRQAADALDYFADDIQNTINDEIGGVLFIGKKNAADSKPSNALAKPEVKTEPAKPLKNPNADIDGKDIVKDKSGKEGYEFSTELKDKKLIKKFDSEEKITVYRAMQVIDGKLYPPMAASNNGKMTDSSQLNKWEIAEEHPELIIKKTDKDGQDRYYFRLDKGGKDATGKKATTVDAAYNPYIHTSRSILNDQFKSAWIRPNLVIVETEIPKSELSSGYKARYAKDSVGEVDWKKGSVSGELAKIGKTRKVILSRYAKPIRVLDNNEVANEIAKLVEGTSIGIPENVVTPKVRELLENKGVKILPPEKGVNKTEQIKEAIAKGLTVEYDVEKISKGIRKGSKEIKFSTELKKPVEFNPTVDADGNKVSENQIKYFEESEVRDESRKLIPMYHGSDAKFDSFDKSKIDLGNSKLQGFWFTSNPDYASQYGAMKVGYLNITKPIPMDNLTITPEQLSKISGYPVKNCIGALKHYKSDYEAINYLSQNSTLDEYNELIDKVKSVLGYDGYIYENKGDTIAVAFESNQFKNADNQNPTVNNDTRYSREWTYVQADDLAEQYDRLSAESAAKDKKIEVLSKAMSNIDYKPDTSTIRKIAKSLRETVPTTTIKQGEIETRLSKLYETIRNSTDGSEVYNLEKSLAEDIIYNGGMGYDADEVKRWNSFKDKLKTIKLKPTEELIAEVGEQEDFNHFRRQSWPTLIISKDGDSMSKVYRTLNEWDSSEFPDGLSDLDAFNLLREKLTDLKPKTLIEKSGTQSVAEYVEDMIDTINDAYFSTRFTPGALATAEKSLQKQYKEAVEAYKAELKRKDDARLEKRKAREDRYELMQDILKRGRRLAKMKGDAKFRAEVDNLIGDVDLVAPGIRKDTKQKLEDLRKQVNEQAAKDPDYARLHKADYDELFGRLEKKPLSEFTIEELNELNQALIDLEHSKRTFDREIKEDRGRLYSEMARVAIEQQRIIENNNFAKKWNPSVAQYKLWMLNPTRAFKMLDGYDPNGIFTYMGKQFNDGQTKQAQFKMEAEKMFEDINNDKELIKDFAEPTIDIGNGIKISKGMRISIYLHSLNRTNLKRLAKGGIRIPNAEYYAKGDYALAYARGKTVKLTPSQVDNIVANMTEGEKRYADIAYKFFNETCKKAINETSMLLDGYEKAIVDNYFPIRTDPNFTQTEIEGLLRDATIEGLPMLKERLLNASNPILLEDVSQVVLRQENNTAKYYGLAIPVRNWNKFWNYNAKQYKTSIKDAVGKAWPVIGQEYLENVVKDLQVSRRSKSDILDKAKSFYAGSVLNLNLGVAIKQSASYPFAASVIGWQPLVKASGKVFKQADYDYMDSITPWGYMRRVGMSGTPTGEVAKQRTNIENATWYQKLKQKTDWIRAVDVKTTDTLFFATEEYVKEKYPNLEVRGEAYNKKVGEIYNEVLQRTQPSYDVMQRNEFLRSGGTVARVAGMFKTQTFNMGGEIMDAYFEWDAMRKRAKTDENYKGFESKAREHFAKTVGATIVSQAMLAGLTALANMVLHKMKPYRDDETGEITKESFFGKLWEDFIRSFAGMTLGGSELLDAILFFTHKEKWYGLSFPGLDTINDVVESTGKWSSALTSAIEDNKIENIKKLSTETAKLIINAFQLRGVPSNNLYNMANAINLWVQDAINGELGTFNAGEGILGVTNTSVSGSQYAKQVVKALQKGDDEKALGRLSGITSSQLLQAIGAEADLDEDGEPIEGSKKQNAIEIIKSYKCSDEAKGKIYAHAFPSDKLNEWVKNGGSQYQYMNLVQDGVEDSAWLDDWMDAKADINDFADTLKSIKKIKETYKNPEDADSKTKKQNKENKLKEVIAYITKNATTETEALVMWKMSGYEESSFKEHFKNKFKKTSALPLALPKTKQTSNQALGLRRV